MPSGGKKKKKPKPAGGGAGSNSGSNSNLQRFTVIDVNSETKNVSFTAASAQQAAIKAFRHFKFLQRTLTLCDEDGEEFSFDASEFELGAVKKPNKKSGGAKPRDRLAYEASMLADDD